MFLLRSHIMAVEHSPPRKAQVAFENVLIVAFSVAVFIPIVFFIYQYATSGTSGVSSAQYEKLGLELLATAEHVRGQGRGSWRTIDANLPAGLTSVNVSGEYELVITYETGHGGTSVVFFSDVMLSNDTRARTNGSIFGTYGPHSGRASFRVTAGNGFVSIAEVTGP